MNAYGGTTRRLHGRSHDCIARNRRHIGLDYQNHLDISNVSEISSLIHISRLAYTDPYCPLAPGIIVLVLEQELYIRTQ